MHVSTKDTALDGLQQAHYSLINQPRKTEGSLEWEIINLIELAIEKLRKIQPENHKEGGF